MLMNSEKVLDALDQIAATSSRNEKEALVAAGAKDPLFRAVLVAAYDPFTTYGVTDLRTVTIGQDTFTELPALLGDLAARRLTGHAAGDATQAFSSQYSSKTISLVRRIITKDLRAGFTAGTCNRAEPGMIPVFEVMLAHKFEEKRIKRWPVAVEPKLDGVRVACVVSSLTPDGVAFLSRNGKPFPAVEHMKPILLEFLAAAGVTHPMFFDGEMVTGPFNKTVGDVRRKSVAAIDAEFVIFDQARLSDFKAGASVPDGVRRDRLEQLFADVDAMRGLKGFPFVLGERTHANSVDEIQELYAAYRARGLEGAIVKPLDAPYVKKRSHAWLKVKNEDTEDLIVTGAFEGTGKYAGMLGGLIVDFKGVEVRVGGGFSDELRRNLWERLMREEVGTVDVTGSMIEVEYHEVTPDGSLRHPRFVRFREDKRPLAEAA